eukprot:gnl/MRDRNA2_/MRDRNA2_180222_c0_seq1.p1 gnl/MRDRNA2_/MRDRNA2_180222_c0~~gnl/MRDRNA2_/MRDRNA2_180222_c0_seq1.p1  ORF type:complete len:327 (-),score=90.44 gnl/MRDRNA2_/MRDRNA2_180222_c0_seq1:40-1020(-)
MGFKRLEKGRSIDKLENADLWKRIQTAWSAKGGKEFFRVKHVRSHGKGGEEQCPRETLWNSEADRLARQDVLTCPDTIAMTHRRNYKITKIVQCMMVDIVEERKLYMELPGVDVNAPDQVTKDTLRANAGLPTSIPAHIQSLESFYDDEDPFEDITCGLDDPDDVEAKMQQGVKNAENVMAPSTVENTSAKELSDADLKKMHNKYPWDRGVDDNTFKPLKIGKLAADVLKGRFEKRDPGKTCWYAKNGRTPELLWGLYWYWSNLRWRESTEEADSKNDGILWVELAVDFMLATAIQLVPAGGGKSIAQQSQFFADSTRVMMKLFGK